MQRTMRAVIVVGDFGKDSDDEDTLILSNGLTHHLLTTQGSRRQESFEMLAVIANLAPAVQRARLARGTLTQLQHSRIPVGIGTDCGVRAQGHDREFVDIPYMADVSELVSGAELLVRTLRSCRDGTVILLLISGLTDMAQLLRENAGLVKRKVATVTIMGGVAVDNDAVSLDADGYMTPDSAANNQFDMESAKYVYRRLQELGIPLTVLTRAAAYAAPFPRDLYDRMANTGHPVGIKLRNSQRRSIQDLWFRANLPADDERRNTLPPRCNKQWFCSTFCGGQGLEREADDEVWDLIKTMQLYDPLTLIAATPGLSEQFYEPTIVSVNGVAHKIIGVSQSVTGVKNASALVSFMTECFVNSLMATRPSSHSI